MTPDMFMRCGHALCGAGPDWKAQFGRLLGNIKPDSIDAMTKGKSRIPPRVWNEIAVHLHDRIQLDLPGLKAAAVEASAAPFSRVYKVRNIEFSVYPSTDDRWPKLKFADKPYNEAAWWRYAGDYEFQLPDNTISVCLEFDGEMGQPMLIQGGAHLPPGFYPRIMQRSPMTPNLSTIIGPKFESRIVNAKRIATAAEVATLQNELDRFAAGIGLRGATIRNDGTHFIIETPDPLRADRVAALQNWLTSVMARFNEENGTVSFEPYRTTNAAGSFES